MGFGLNFLFGNLIAALALFGGILRLLLGLRPAPAGAHRRAERGCHRWLHHGEERLSEILGRLGMLPMAGIKVLQRFGGLEI